MTLNIPPAWRRALPAFLLVLLAVLLLFGRTGLAMVEIWDRSGTFAHAFVVPPISLWLIWRQRAQLALMAPRASWLALPLMAMAAFGWLLGDLVAVNSVTQLAFTAMIVLCVPLLLGWSVTRVLVFPLAFLFFCVPIGEFMMPQMMEWTADFTVLAVRLSGVPVYREGLSFVIPSGTWSVVEACSGIRYLIASVMVGTLFAYLNYRSLKRRLIFTGVSFVLPLVANWLRAYMIVMLALFMIGMRWAEPDLPLPEPSLKADVRTGTGSAAVAFVALLLLLSPRLITRQLVAADADRAALPMLSTPDLSARDWRPVLSPDADLKPHFEQPRAELQASYAQPGGAAVGLYLAYYRHQDYTSKLVSSNNVLVRADDKKWRSTNASATELEVGNQLLSWRTAQLRATDLSQLAGDRQLLAWQIYWVAGHWTRSDTLAKLYALQSRLMGAGDDSAVLVLYADSAQGGEPLLRRFAEENFVPITAWLSGIRHADVGSAQGK